VSADGGVFSFGKATFKGSEGGKPLASPIVGMAPTPDGEGYWLVAADGGVFSFGDAAFLGSLGAQPLVAPIVGIAPTPDGRGYWLAAADGGVFSFGDAAFLGSLGGQGLPAKVVGVTADRANPGYWLVSAAGGVYSFGAATYHGSQTLDPDTTPAAALASTPDGGGYWLAAGEPKRVPLGSFLATCYTGGGTTAAGTPTSTNVVAVDPSVIPLGTTLWISGIGTRVALDTGGAIRGDRLDIWQPSYDQCVQFGAESVAVYIEG
jgi:3D (Asp-Asp-Asp) domain-containing protein